MNAIRCASRSRLTVVIAVSGIAFLGACAGGEEQSTAPVQKAPAPAIAVSVPSSAFALVQGQSASIVVSVVRTAVNGGVDLSVEGLPTGVTAAFESSSLSAGNNSSALSMKAAFDVAPQTFTLTVRAKANGVADATATLPVTITAAPKNLSLRFCSLLYPVWVAVQAEGGKWIQVNPDADSVFRVAIGSGGGVATVNSFKNLDVVYGSVDDLASIFTPCQIAPFGSKKGSGDVAGLDGGVALISLGSNTNGVGLGGSEFQFFDVANGPRDLVASRIDAFAQSYAVSSLVIRRSLNLADGARLPTIDFHSAEAFAPAKATLTVQNFVSLSEVWLTFSTANGSSQELFSAQQGSARQTYVGVPSSRLAAGDVQALVASDEVSPFPNGVGRIVAATLTGVVDQTFTFGPPLATATLSAIGGSAYPRWRAVLPVQPEYSAEAGVEFDDPSGRYASIVGIGAFIPKTTAGWDLAIPDFGPIGFDASFGLRPGSQPSLQLFAAGGSRSLLDALPGTVNRASIREQGSTALAIAGRSSPRPHLIKDFIQRATRRPR